MPKVKVPQKSGEIVLTSGRPTADAPRTYSVKDGVVTVAAEHLDEFLTHVEGSALAEAPPKE